MKLLASVATCLLLSVATPSVTSGSDSNPSINPATPGGPTSSVSVYKTRYNSDRTILDALEMKAVSGTGAGTDFACGFMSGAGLILTLSGVATPIGVTLAVGSVACSLFL